MGLHDFPGPFNDRLQILTGIGTGHLTDFFRRSGGYHFTTPVAAFGAEIDNMVRHFHYIQVVFDNNHRISLVHQLLENNEELPDILTVQASGRLIEDIERISRSPAHKFRSQLYALGFTAGHGGRRLSQMDIAKAHFLEGLQFPQNSGMILKERHRLIYGHIENIGNVLSFVTDFQGFPIIPGAVADFTGHINIRKKLHFNLYDAITVTGLATAAFDIETETSWLIAPHLCFRCLDEPSIGLHQRDNDKLLATLKGMRDLGNTLIVVEHDEDTIRSADWVVDIGPGAGENGGYVVAQGTPEDIKKVRNSITGAYLRGEKYIPLPEHRRN